MTAPVKPRSRQRDWQLKQRAAGRCQVCGKKASRTSKAFCPKHRATYNAWRRQWAKARRATR